MSTTIASPPSVPESPRKHPLAFLLVQLGIWQRLLLRTPFLSPDESHHWIFHLIATVLHRLFIVPITNLTPNDFALQFYLLSAFHLGWISFIGHGVLMPLVLIQLAYALGPKEFCVPLAIFWAVAALWAGKKLWALCSCGIAFAIYHSALILGPLNPYSPSATISVLGFLIALSHAKEVLYPPRASSDQINWIRLSELIIRRGFCYVAAHVFFSLLCGTFQEAVASTRLFPYFFLILMVSLGYEDSQVTTFKRAAQILMKTEMAAVDFVGLITEQAVSIPVELLDQLDNMTTEERVQNFEMVVKSCNLEAILDAEEIQFLKNMLSNSDFWPERSSALDTLSTGLQMMLHSG